MVIKKRKCSRSCQRKEWITVYCLYWTSYNKIIAILRVNQKVLSKKFTGVQWEFQVILNWCCLKNFFCYLNQVLIDSSAKATIFFMLPVLLCQQWQNRSWGWGQWWEKACGPRLKECSGTSEKLAFPRRGCARWWPGWHSHPGSSYTHKSLRVLGSSGVSCLLSELQLPPPLKRKKSLESWVR